jgi:hypothetical protein
VHFNTFETGDFISLVGVHLLFMQITTPVQRNFLALDLVGPDDLHE